MYAYYPEKLNVRRDEFFLPLLTRTGSECGDTNNGGGFNIFAAFNITLEHLRSTQ